MGEDQKREQREKRRAEARKNFRPPEVTIRGAIELFDPIKSRDVDIFKLHYDYSKLNSTEIIACLDQDPDYNNARSISNRQAFAMFAISCEKCERGTTGLDAQDISERLSGRDVIACVRTAKSFFANALAGALLSISET